MCSLDDDRACQLVGNDGWKQRMQVVLAKYCSSRSGLCHPSECCGDQACKCHYDSYHWPEHCLSLVWKVLAKKSQPCSRTNVSSTYVVYCVEAVKTIAWWSILKVDRHKLLTACGFTACDVCDHPELQNVKSFTRTKIIKQDFTPRKARKSRHL